MIKKIPVIDLKQHRAVSGKSGMRDTYQPLRTVFATSSNPVEIAQGLKLNGADEMYIADLDLIESVGHNINDVKMANTVLPVMFDGGVKNCEGFEFFLDYAFKIIIPTETLESIEEMEKIFGVDSLGFLNLEDVSKLGEGGGCKGYCMACFDGNYPTNPPSTTNRNKYDIKLSESET